MEQNRRIGIIIDVLSLLLVEAAQSQQTRSYFTLQTLSHASEGNCLEGNGVVPGAQLGGASFMANCGDVGGQLWRMEPVGNGHFQLRTKSWEKENKCLEGNNVAPGARLGGGSFMDSCANVPGQSWKMEPTANGFFRLKTMGDPDKCLEGNGLAPGSFLGGAAFMAPCGNVSGQIWRRQAGRSAVDRPDDFSGSQIKLLYVLPKDGVDDAYDYAGQIANQVLLAALWSQEQVGRQLRYDTFQGALDITFVRLDLTAAGLRQKYREQNKFIPIHQEVRDLGFDSPQKAYVIFYGGSDLNGDCQSFGGSRFATLLLKQGNDPSDLQECGFAKMQSATGPFRQPNETGTVASLMVHELFHAVGMVPPCAKNVKENNGHLAPNTSDIMSFDGSGFTTLTLDSPRDQYYGHGRDDCPDLANSGIWADTPSSTPLTPKASGSS